MVYDWELDVDVEDARREGADRRIMQILSGEENCEWRCAIGHHMDGCPSKK